MPLSINTNIASMTAQRSFLQSNAALEQAFERLSTGKRVNSAVDDAAGLAVGKDLEAKVSGLNQAIRNVNDGISMVQIVEGTLDEVTTILQRMRDLAVQASNGSLSSTELGYLDTEHSKLATALDSALDQAKFNTTDLMDNNGTSFTIQSGASAGETTSISIDGLTDSVLAVAPGDISLNAAQSEKVVISGLTISSGGASDVYRFTVGGTAYDTIAATVGTAAQLVSAINGADTNGDGTGTALSSVGTATLVDGRIEFVFTATGDQTDGTPALTYQSGGGSVSATVAVGYDGTASAQASASAAITRIDSALATVASDRATLGATQAQLESTVRNLSNVAENTAAAAGRIMDTDYAAETANLTKAQILQQAATSVLAQANAQPQAVLALLQ
jgi:flagellin